MTNATLQKTATGNWKIDPAHSSVEFSAKHMMLTTVRGRFERFDAKVHVDEENILNSTVEATIDAASLNTNVEYRDNHLRSVDFLDVENHPTITFVSKRIERKGGDQYRIIGDLTIRGVTREVALDTTFEGWGVGIDGNKRAGFTASTKINRKGFGLTWNVAIETGGMLVGETVNINLDVQLVKQPAQDENQAAA